MGKGYKRKTRWRTLNIGAPPGEEDEEDGIRNGYVKGQENGTSSRNGQTGHKTGRTDSAGSTTSDYASDYASAASRSRRDDSVGSPAQPKIIFNENEYTRITTPRQDVLFKKGYLSRKKVWASTASTSATPSTTESQSASHSTADGSETTEDQRLLDYKENGAEEYQAMMEAGAQVAYGTFYDHASGYYYEYPVMVVGPGPGIPGGPPMHNVLTAVPCGPVPLRPIEWVNPAFVPKIGNEQYCVMDYQTAQMGQYPVLVDENGVPLTAQTENGIGSEEAYHENGIESASWTGSAADEEQSDNNAEQNIENGTTETSTAEMEEIAENSINSDHYMETALAQQLHMTHVAGPPMPEPYVYPGHYMFGPSLINVNGVTIQSGPMVRNAGITGGPANTGACAKRRKKKKMSRRKPRGPPRLGNPETDEQEEEEYSSGTENAAGQAQLGIVNEVGTAGIEKVDQAAEGSIVTTSHGRPLNPECQEFRPILESRIVSMSNNTNTGSETILTSPTSVEPSSSVETTDKEQRVVTLSETDEKSVPQASIIDEIDHQETINTKTIAETTTKSVPTDVETIENLVSRQMSEEIEAVPVDFAAEVFANVSIMAERALAPRSVVEGTPMETEIGLDATSVNFQEIVEILEIRANDNSPQDPKDSLRNCLRAGESIEKENAPNSVEEQQLSSCERKCTNEQAPEPLAEASLTNSDSRERPSTINEKRGSRSASPGMINRTTTPINANSQRLPESYESLVTRGLSVASSLPTVSTMGNGQQPRNRKYSSKQASKFVREATPGPDLDVAQTQNNCVNSIDIKMTNNKAESGNNNIDGGATTRISRTCLTNDSEDDNEAIVTGIEAFENELQRYSVTTDGSTSYGCERNFNRVDQSNDDSGVESQTRLSSEHPITDAVTEWLQRANSPELFVTSTMMSESEPEDDELENEEPPKNLQGNPMPALSANSSDVNDSELSRLACFGKFAIKEENNVNVNEESMIERKMIKDNTNNGMPRRKRRGNASRRETRINSSKMASKLQGSEEKTVNVDINTNNSVDSARLRLPESSSSSSEIENRINVNETCEFTENDSVAGMRVAKSSRTKKNMALMKMMMDSCESHEIGEIMKRSGTKDRMKKTIAASNREVPVENVEVKVRRMGIDENDEGIVEDEEVSVRTFEKGQIVVSIEGKVLPVDSYEPILLQKNEELDERPKFSTITCEKSRMNEMTIGEETSPSECASKRNSLGSIEEPDVLECWEVETVEPVTTPKRIQTRGEELEGEAAEDELDGTSVIVDPAGMEIVRKYYRLEAMRDSGTSVTSIDDYCPIDNIDENHIKLLKSPDQMIESICSEDIPVIGEKMSKIVERMLDRSGIPIDEALEVYESCYGEKPAPSYLAGLEAKFRSTGRLYGQDPEREGVVPCKAACCNIQ